MNKMYDVITALDICIDFLIGLGDTIPEFGQKEKIVDSYDVELGGSCCIFACQAAKLGLKTSGIGVAGKDSFGDIVLKKLSDSGVITDNIRIDSSIKTGMGAALCKKSGDRSILTYLGTIDAVVLEDYKDNLIMNTRHIHIGSYYLMKKLQPYYVEILKKAKQEGVSVSLDTNWDPEETWDSGIWDILPYVDIFLPNENEAKLITGESTIEDATRKLAATVPIIAMKLGKNGACAYNKDGFYKSDALNVKVIDTVGAGDSFDAGFVYGYLRGMGIADCLKMGCICGSLNTSMSGGIEGQPNEKNALSLF